MSRKLQIPNKGYQQSHWTNEQRNWQCDVQQMRDYERMEYPNFFQ
jgi:hypothetical protein